MIKCVIVDDNKMARMAMEQMIKQVSDMVLVKQCESAMEAYNTIQQEPIDLLFLDIEMPEISGLEFAKQIRNQNTSIIFTTAKKDYAVDAFETNVIDYLIKPIPLTRFLQSIEKLKSVLTKNGSNMEKEEPNFFFVKDKGALKKIMIEDILYFEAMGDYVKIYVGEKNYLINTTLKLVEQKVNAGQFIRIHRSYIAALNKIDSIEDGVLFIQKYRVPIADSYKSSLNQKLKFL